ncbi:hypothetical protein Pst134EB_021501 [Puccinia striiformis f. sp. tritici]|nr:hypothetical protein Pst134EB_021501 [Puccinia striiformis f. sp. tritici]
MAGFQRKCLIDTGSAIDIITEAASMESHLTRRALTHPIRIKLALHESNAEPIFLRHLTSTTIRDHRSGLSFNGVPLLIGPISGDYDLILGAPFLTRFDLLVSMRNRLIRCETTGKTISDYRHELAATTIAVIESDNYPRDESTKKILNDYVDLFPIDIPAISEEEEDTGLFTDGSFPDKLQPESSRVRHCIILTDPAAVVNEKQYPYPCKYMVAWRTLLEQHLKAGRIQRLSSHSRQVPSPQRRRTGTIGGVGKSFLNPRPDECWNLIPSSNSLKRKNPSHTDLDSHTSKRSACHLMNDIIHTSNFIDRRSKPSSAPPLELLLDNHPSRTNDENRVPSQNSFPKSLSKRITKSNLIDRIALPSRDLNLAV